MNTELKEAIEALEKEKNIMRETLFEAIENALLTACKSNFGRVDNIKAWVDRDTFEYYCTAEKEVVETKDDVEDKLTQIALEDAVKFNPAVRPGDKVEVKINSQSFGRIATQIAKNVILQKIREEERSAIYDYYIKMQKNIVTGIVQRINGGNISVNLGRAEGLLNEKETVPGEHLKPTDRIKVYIIDVRTTNRGPRILVSRTHPELVKKLFEQEVAEIQDKVVEIKSIAREAGSRTKIAVYSNDPKVDAVGACVGVNGIRVNNIVDELRGEKIDIINWDENPGNLIQNALSPAKIVAVFADPEEKTAKVVVPDYQLSLAIGREGQNARLAAKLTGYKIDIKSETQAKDAYGFRYEDYLDEDEEEDEEEYSGEYAGEESGDENAEGEFTGEESGDENAEGEFIGEESGDENAEGGFTGEESGDENTEGGYAVEAPVSDSSEDEYADGGSDQETSEEKADNDPAGV